MTTRTACSDEGYLTSALMAILLNEPEADLCMLRQRPEGALIISADAGAEVPIVRKRAAAQYQDDTSQIGCS